MLIHKEKFYYECLEMTGPGRPVLTMSLNIPARVWKNSDCSMHKKWQALFKSLKKFVSREIAGSQPFMQARNGWFVSAAWQVRGSALYYKALCLVFEKIFPSARALDLDVLKTDGNFVSRTNFGLPELSCYICKRPVNQCRHGSNHTSSQLEQAFLSILHRLETCFPGSPAKSGNDRKECLAKTLSFMAAKALLKELCLTPKPGLVDLGPRSAHKDMNALHFFNSLFSIAPLLDNFFVLGSQWAGGKGFYDLRDYIRDFGIYTESTMFKATGNINTHRGAIFIFGLALSAAGYMYENKITLNPGALCSSIKQLFGPAMKAELTGLGLKNIISPARESALKGYDLALKALEIYKNCVLTKKSFAPGSEKPSLLTMAYIGANLKDSNIIARAGVKGLEYSMKKFESAYYSGLENPKNLPFLMESLDIDFSGRRISPGGAADIFALTCFLFMLEKSGPEFAVFVL